MNAIINDDNRIDRITVFQTLRNGNFDLQFWDLGNWFYFWPPALQEIALSLIAQEFQSSDSPYDPDFIFYVISLLITFSIYC